MTNEVKTALEAIGMVEVGGYASRVRGRRNYSVRIETSKKVAFVGGHGAMKSRRLMSEYLKTIAKYGITWVSFTYKKDLFAFIRNLEEQDFTIIWID